MQEATNTTPQVDPFVPLKFKLYLSPKERQAYRLAANVVGKESIADYIVHAIQTYTTFIIKELQNQVQTSVDETANQTASSAEVAPTVESGHVTEANP